MLLFFKKNKEKQLDISLFYTCILKILMIWSTVIVILWYGVWQTEIGDCGSFFALLPQHPPPPLIPPSLAPLKNRKPRILKNCLRAKSGRRSGVFIVNFEHNSHLILMFHLLLWTSKCLLRRASQVTFLSFSD